MSLALLESGVEDSTSLAFFKVYTGLKQPSLVRPSACREQCPFLCDLAMLATCMWDCTESTVRAQGTMRWLVAGDIYCHSTS